MTADIKRNVKFKIKLSNGEVKYLRISKMTNVPIPLAEEWVRTELGRTFKDSNFAPSNIEDVSHTSDTKSCQLFISGIEFKE